jgi:phosphonoacetaldehyde hydrolase
VIDHGCLAPLDAFVRAFASFGVAIDAAEARGPMGMAKRDHVAAVMAAPRVAAAWAERRGRAPTEADVEAVYAAFVPMTVAAAVAHATLIDGAAGTVAALRARGLAIGSTTGYTREIMEPLLPLAARQGYAPDSLLGAGDLPEGRPAPMMMYRTFLELGVWPAAAVVKVDDTAVGVGEGLNAGAWTVGVALTGNVFGLSPAETAALSPSAFAARLAEARGALRRAGAHVVVDSVADLIPAIDAIEGRLVRGERP